MMAGGNLFSNAYQWQPPDNSLPGAFPTSVEVPSPPLKNLSVLEKNLLQLLGQFQQKGIPVNDLWKYYKRIYRYEPNALNYGVQHMNDILPKFQKNIGIDYAPSGACFILTKLGEDAYMGEFHPEYQSEDKECCTFDTISSGAQPPDPKTYYLSKHISYSQVATSGLPEPLSQQNVQHIPQTFRQQIFPSDGYRNSKPLTKENLTHAVKAGKPKERERSVKEILAEPAWFRASQDSEDQTQLYSTTSFQDMIQALSPGLSKLEAAIQQNIITILAKFHPNGVPVRSIWGLYKKQHKSVPTKQDLQDIQLKSINTIFERFSHTIVRKSVGSSMNFVLSTKGVEYARKLHLLPEATPTPRDQLTPVPSVTRPRLLDKGQ